MFEAITYVKRRELLKKQVPSGLILFLGNEDSPMNYAANTYHFRQDSSFLYFYGLDSPGLAAVIDVEEQKDMLFGNDIGIEDIIWMGYLPTLKERAAKVGVNETAPLKDLEGMLKEAAQKGRPIHFLPPYRAESQMKLLAWLGIPPKESKSKSSPELIKAAVAQRSVKSEEEIAQDRKSVV